MRLSGLRIIGVTLALALGGAAVFYLQHAHPPSSQVEALPELRPPPWIPLPETPSLLEAPQTRDAILRLLVAEHSMDLARIPLPGPQYHSLMFGCSDSAAESDSFRMWVSPPWGPSWRVEIRTHGDSIRLSRFELEASAEQSEVRAAVTGAAQRNQKYEYLGEVSRQSLEEVRAVWNTKQLWHGPNTEEQGQCLDGTSLILDACVRGKYALRHHHCREDSFRMVDELIAAAESLIQRQRALAKRAPSSSNL